MTPELQSRVLVWRQKAIDGTLTLEDQIEAVRVLREGRLSASIASANAKKTASKKPAPILNADDLLEDL